MSETLPIFENFLKNPNRNSQSGLTLRLLPKHGLFNGNFGAKLVNPEG
jgi:hypothetical protein